MRSPNPPSLLPSSRRWAILQDRKPIAIRVPGNGVNHTTETVDSVYDYEPHYKITREGEQVAIIAAGSFYQKGENVVRLLADKGVHATLVNPRYLNADVSNPYHSLNACTVLK